VAVVFATAGFTIWHNHKSVLEEHQRDMTKWVSFSPNKPLDTFK
jgi:hypothetical protein